MVGIVVLNYNSIEKCRTCIASIRKNTKVPYMIYLVDNASTDNSWKEITDTFAGNRDIVAIEAGNNAGYSAGNNIGLKAAVEQGCEYVMVANPDVIFANDVARELSSSMENDKSIGLAAPFLTEADHKSIGQLFRGEYTFTRAIMNRKPFIYIARLVKSLDLNLDIDPYKPAYIDGMTSGCCYMFRSTTLQDINYLDENVFLYHEEFIIGDKLQKVDAKVFYNPNAVAVHNHIDASNICTANENLYRYLSALYYLKNYQHCNKLQMLIAYLQNYLLLATRALRRTDYREALKSFRKYCRNNYKKH